MKREDATVTAIAASGILTERGGSRLSKQALKHLGAIAARRFPLRPVAPEKLNSDAELLQSTTYWHGTGRYQRHGGKIVDVFGGILEQGELRPSLDPFDPDLGMTETVSLAKKRAYALAYADMHSDNPAALERLLPAQTLANFYVVRAALTHGYREAQKHPDGVRAGTKALLAEARNRHAQLPQSWKQKTTTRKVNELYAFGVGSDIPGNYPILLGFDDQVPTIKTSAAIAATREVRTDKPISLSRLVHVEVPVERMVETQTMLSEHGLDVPVVAIEDMEQVVARMPIADVLV